MDGLLYHKVEPVAPLRLTLSNNTFSSVENVGLHFETTPNRESSRIALVGNLFAHTDTLARIDDFRPEPRSTQAQWIWSEAAPPTDGATETRDFRKHFTVDGSSIAQGVLNLTCDASFTVWLNGERVGHGDFQGPDARVQAFDVTRYLRPGANLIAVQATGKVGGPSGLLTQLAYACPGDPQVMLVSDDAWKTARTALSGWQQLSAADENWASAKVIAPYGKGEAGWQHLVWTRWCKSISRARSSSCSRRRPATSATGLVRKTSRRSRHCR